MAPPRLHLAALLLIISCFAGTIAAESCSTSSSAPISLTLSNVSIASQDTSTYGIRVDVGLPRQNLCLTPSTVVDNTLLISTKICTGEQNITLAQCRSYHGGTFDFKTAGASFNNVSLAAAQLPADPGWNEFNPSYSAAGQTQLDLVANNHVPNMTVIVITEGVNFTAGHVGLGKQSVLLRRLKEADLIPSLGFGLNAGSQSIQNPREGSLVLGGYDSASVLGPFHEYRMNYSDTLAKRHCPLQVYIKGLQLNLEGRSSIQLLGDGDGHAACIEPYDNLFRLSELGLARFAGVTGWSPKTTYSSSLFLPEPGLIYPSTTGFNGSLKFVLEDGFTVEIPNSELQHPLRGLDSIGNHVLQPNITEVNIYNEPLGAWVLGKVFLSQVYLAVDYDAQVIKLAEVKQNAVTPFPVRFGIADVGCSNSKLSGASIAAIVLGIFVGLALIIGAGFCARSRRRKQRNQIETLAQHHAPPPEPLTIFTDANPVDSTSLSQEMSGERRTFELWSPSGHADASPPAQHVLPHVTSPFGVTAQRDSMPSNDRPSTYAAEPWLQ